MRWKKTLQMADVHCEGEIGKVITGGVVRCPRQDHARQDELHQ